jgi:hypothetical protein
MNTYILASIVIACLIIVSVVIVKYKENMTIDEKYVNDLLYSNENNVVTETPAPTITMNEEEPQEQDETITQLNPKDLLPSNEKLDEFDEDVSGLYIDNTDYLTEGQQVGIDTIVSSKKNTSLDLRGDIYIPKIETLWNNSSYIPTDMNNRHRLDFCTE